MQVMHRSTVLFVLAALAAGCSSTEPSRQTEILQPAPPRSSRMTITTEHGSYQSAAPARLKVYWDSSPTAELMFSGRTDDRAWGFLAILDPAQLQLGAHTLPLSNSPSAQGVASVTAKVGQTSEERASSGTVSFELLAGSISGSVIAVPVAIGATFQGDLAVECWVPGSVLGADPNGPGDKSPDGDEGLIEDAKLISEPCAPLRALRQP